MEGVNKKKQNSLKSLLDHQLLDAMGDSITVHDTDFRILFMNKAAIRIVGDYVGEYCYKVFESRDSKCTDCPLIRSFKDGKIHRAERKTVLEGRTLYLEIIGSSVKDSDGKIIAGIETARNITQQKVAEDMLAVSEEKYRLLFHVEKDAIVIVDMESGAIRDVNEASAGLYGYSMEELLSMSALDLSVNREESRINLDRMADFDSDRHFRHENIHRKKDGTEFPVEISAGTFMLNGRKMVHAVFRDITERRIAEDYLVSSEQRYRSLVESTEDSIYLVDRGYKYLFMNRHHLSRLDITSEDYPGKKYGDLHVTGDADAFHDMVDSVFETGESCQQEYKALKDKKYFLRTFSPIKDNEGEVDAVTVVSKNITDRKDFEYNLQLNEERYRSLVESTDDSVYLVDKNYMYIFMNKQHMKRIGLSVHDVKDRSYLEIHSIDETREFIKLVDDVFDTGDSVQQEHRSIKDGMHFLRTLSPVKDNYGKVVAVTVISKNITDRKSMEEDLRTLAITDELTGLYNRRGFLTLAGQQLKLASRLKRGVLLFYADLDGLKMINDRYGHQEGDTAILETSNILKSVFRESDIVARIGGDEFVVFPVQVTDSSAETLSRRFNEHLERKNNKRDGRYGLSVSIGIVYYEECLHSIEELLVEADNLMYEQKKEKNK